MAETLTFENTTETTSAENLNADEQESLVVGEQLEEAQESMLAGKYKDAQELEKAYIALEKKMGEKSGQDSQEESSDEPQAEEKSDKEPTDSDGDFTFLDDFYDQASSDKGDIEQELLDKISGMSTRDMAQQFLQWRADAETKYQPIPDMSEQNVKELKGVVGGEQNYANMLQWAQSNLSKQEIDMFDSVMGRGDVASAFFAINSLAQRYQDKVGYDGKMLTGTAPKGGTDTFRSQPELVQAMSDPRYDNDPAYRMDVMEKLARSDMKF